MSRSRESRPRGSRKQQTKITYSARARTLNRLKKIYHGAQGFALLAHSLLFIIYPDIPIKNCCLAKKCDCLDRLLVIHVHVLE